MDQQKILQFSNHAKERTEEIGISIEELLFTLQDSAWILIKLPDKERILLRSYSVDLILSADLKTVISVIGTSVGRKICKVPTIKDVFFKSEAV